MSFIDELKPIITKKGFLVISGGILSSLIWILLFSFEFRALEEANASLPGDYRGLYVLYHLIALPFGSLLYLLWSTNHDQKMSYIVSCILLAISMAGLAVAGSTEVNPFLIIVFLIVTGLINGYVIPVIFSLLSLFFKNLEYNGRTYYLAYSGVIVVIILEVIIAYFIKATNDFIGEMLHILYLMGLILVVVTTFFIGKDESILLPRKTHLRYYLRKNVLPYPVLLLSFFIGFFMTNVYYTSNAMFYSPKFTEIMSRNDQSWNIFLLVLFITSLVACLPSGYLYDKIGRRWSILIGFYLEAIAFISLPGIIRFILETLFKDIPPTTIEEIVLLIIYPVIVGMGLSLALFGGLLVVLYEQAPEGFSEIHGGISTMAFGFGMVFGVITVTALGPIIESQQILLPFVMIFVYFTATIVIFQTDEPLPSRAELDWRRKVEHVLVLSREGLPLFSQSFQERELVSDEILAGGFIIGIKGIINDITQAPSELKVIKHKTYCIMLEEGTHVILAVLALEELKTIRSKMIDFTADFEEFFEDFLVDWTGNTQVFKPAKKLLKKHFI